MTWEAVCRITIYDDPEYVKNMKAWTYEVGDVLLVKHKGSEVVVRITKFLNALDDKMPIYVNLRISQGLRWGQREVLIEPEQIIKPLSNWYTEQEEKWQASIKATADAAYAKMTPEQRERLQQEMGIRARRSPIEIMIDRAVGKD